MIQPFVASLPMYNLPEMQAANRSFWQALSQLLAEEGLSGLPAELAFARPPVPDAIGTDVVFTQTCGYPLQTIYRGQHELVGVPTYDAPGCGDTTHCAFILVRDESTYRTLESLRGSVFALNSRHSNSGMNLPRRLLADIAGGKAFFREVVETGSHNASIERVQARSADCASIDNMTYTFMQDYRPSAVAGLRVLTQTPVSPAIPFITAMSRSRDEVAAISRALLRMPAEPHAQEALRALRITNISRADRGAYQILMRYESEAAALGYPVLA